LRSYKRFRWHQRNKLAIAKGVFASVNCSRLSNSVASGKIDFSPHQPENPAFPLEAGVFAPLRDTFQELRQNTHRQGRTCFSREAPL
jgi:hypothetical protein